MKKRFVFSNLVDMFSLFAGIDSLDTERFRKKYSTQPLMEFPVRGFCFLSPGEATELNVSYPAIRCKLGTARRDWILYAAPYKSKGVRRSALSLITLDELDEIRLFDPFAYHERQVNAAAHSVWGIEIL